MQSPSSDDQIDDMQLESNMVEGVGNESQSGRKTLVNQSATLQDSDSLNVGGNSKIYEDGITNVPEMTADINTTERDINLSIGINQCNIMPPKGAPEWLQKRYQTYVGPVDIDEVSFITETCSNEEKTTSLSQQSATMKEGLACINPKHIVQFQDSTVIDTALSDSTATNVSSECDDPFAVREGKTLSWTNVNMKLKVGSEKRKILDNVSGEVPKKELTAIMGPSGAGKSSLLQVLAGRIGSRGRVSVKANIYVNNNHVNPRSCIIRKQIAFVAQDDSLQVTSTPREAIWFSAKLRSPRTTTAKQLNNLTTKILSELGLDSCADTLMGGPLIKGISGGERKRTSVGVELVVKPSVVFLDEPTSGLDSFSAVKLCQVLKKVALAGSGVLFTIHQPSSEVFNSFDHLILLNKGRVMYQGSLAGVKPYFDARGFPVPPSYNPADWIMSVAQRNTKKDLEAHGFFEDKNDIESGKEQLEINNKLGKNQLEIDGSPNQEDFCDNNFTLKKIEASSIQTEVGISTQVMLLLQREVRYYCRDTKQLTARAALSLGLSILIGSVYWKIGSSDLSEISHLQSLFGALTMLLMHSIMGSALPALLAFPVERPVFLREYSTNHYSVFSYFIARLITEGIVTGFQIFLTCFTVYFMIGMQSHFVHVFLITYGLGMTSTAMAVMLGCSIEDPKLGTELAPIVFVPQLILSGFFVSPFLIPLWLRWTRYIFALTYGMNLLLVLELGETCGGGIADVYCDTILKNAEARELSPLLNWVCLIALFISFRLMALIILQKKATKFL